MESRQAAELQGVIALRSYTSIYCCSTPCSISLHLKLKLHQCWAGAACPQHSHALSPTCPSHPRVPVNRLAEERTDTHHSHKQLAHGVALDGSHFPFCCTNHLLFHPRSCSTRAACSKSFLHQHQQEPLPEFQPGLHPELIRSCS